tara:strand:- start:1184 stop:2608 length:1425 start_codon:yes stop_codon:yes gene_type:complete
MPFLKMDTSGMNARYGRAKVAPEKSRQVTEFNTPAKNRAPDIPKTEAKEGDILSYFDDGKGKVLTSFDGGYQSAMTAKVSDMNRVDLGFDPISIEAGKGSRISFRGVIQAGLVGQNIITIDSNNKTQYIPSGTKKLYLDGSQGGEVGAFVRANTACEINEIIIDDHGGFDAAIVILESGGANWTFEFGTSSAQNNDLVMDSDDLFYAELSSNDMIITSGGRAMFTRSSNDWKLHSLSSLDGIIMQTGALQPIADDTYDLGASTKEWKDLYVDGTAYIDTLSAGSMSGSFTSNVASTGNFQAGAGATDDASFSCGQINLGMYRYATNVIGFTCNDEDSYRLADGYFKPGFDNNSDLGASDLAWKDVYYEGTITDTSDIRFKKNVDDSDLGLSFINDLRSVKYNHKTDDDTDKKKYGLIAQEVQEALSTAGVDDFSGVADQDEDHLRLDYTQFVAPLIKAVQELSKEVEELKKNAT